MLPTCSMCGRVPEEAGVLCLSTCPWDATRPWYECASCTREGLAFAADCRVIAEDYDDWVDHVRGCSFCHQNKGLIPRLALFQACSERRRKAEVQAREREMVSR